MQAVLPPDDPSSAEHEISESTRHPSMLYVSPKRLHAALRSLHDWGGDVGQPKTHLATFLSAKLKGMNPVTDIEFRDSDDKTFWNDYMRLRGADKPFFDPVEGAYRPVNYPHNSAFKSRNDRWTNQDYAVAVRSGDTWRFTDDYVARLRSKVLKNGTRLIPEADVVAWLYRSRPQPPDTDYAALRDRFRRDFHLTSEELAQLFTSDDAAAQESDFWADRRVSDDLLAEIAKGGASFDLPAAIEAMAEHAGPQPVDLDDVVALAQHGRGQLIFQGPPGTGKTYLARQVTASILGAPREVVLDDAALSDFLAQHRVPAGLGDGLPVGAPGAWDLVQFHPSYTYEDFVRGITSAIDPESRQPVFMAEDKTLAGMARLAASVTTPVILIVDEINRGDLAKVMGELVFALEYRDEAVRTPYEVDGSALLRLPRNFLLLATMNTADRSIALIDYAIRRRFDFVELGASRDALTDYLQATGVGPDITQRTLALFDAVNQPLADMADHQVGHTYFMAKDPADTARRLVFQVLPLLAEYRREGLIGQNVRVKPVDWVRDRGIPLVHPRPFDLVEQVDSWLRASGS